MSVTQTRCQNCAAELEVSESVRYASCNACGASLEVVRELAVTYTRRLPDAVDLTDEAHLRVLELRGELERFDRQWEVTRESFMVSYTTRIGMSVEHHRTIPKVWMAAAVLGFSLVFVVVFTAVGMSFAGLLHLGLGLAASGWLYKKVLDHQRAKVAMESERAELVMRLEAAKRQARRSRAITEG